MATKKILAEQILQALGHADVTFKVDIREIEAMIDQVRDDLARNDYFQLIQMGERDLAGEYVNTFTQITVLVDTVRQLEYVEMPSTHLRLPNGEGLFAIYPAGKPFDRFIPTRPGDQSLLFNHPAFRTEGKPSYWPEFNRVYFTSSVKSKTPKIDMQVLCSSEEGQYPLPNDLANKIFDIVFARFRGKLPADTVADGIDRI